MRKILTLVAAIAILGMLATASLAAVAFDPATGTGFVGKGDVQLALGLNNNQIQSTTVAFTVASVTESEWNCVKVVVTGNGNENVITQERSTTTTVQGVVSSTARLRNQITGYTLNGYSSSTTTTDGPAIGSCPNDNSNFVEGSVTTTSSGGLLVNGVPL